MDLTPTLETSINHRLTPKKKKKKKKLNIRRLYYQDTVLISRVVITKYHKLSGLKQQKFIVSQFWRLEVQNRVLMRHSF